MKILHISASDRGGAGIAATRLHLALLEAGIESKLLCKQLHDKEIPGAFEQSRTKRLSFIQRVKHKLNLYQTAKEKKENIIKSIPGTYEVFSCPFSDYELHKHDLVKEADIIHLHWVANYLDYNSFFKFVQKPIVWTLHDMNPFLGGFHYMNDVRNNQNYEALENQFKRIKQEACRQNNNFHIVTLSNYLKQQSESSDVFGDYPHHLIPNGYEPKLNIDIEKKCCKKVFGIPENNRVILFVSENINNHRKGFDILLEAIENTTMPDNFSLVAMGDQSQISSDKIVCLGLIHHQQLLEMAYIMADAFILPSREDNLPNTMLEALTHGVPVISFSNGGMKDHVNNENGILINDCSSEILSHAINTFFENPDKYSKDKIATESRNIFALSKQTRAYENLYESILN